MREKLGIWVLLACIWVSISSSVNGSTDQNDGKVSSFFGFFSSSLILFFFFVLILDPVHCVMGSEVKLFCFVLELGFV